MKHRKRVETFWVGSLHATPNFYDNPSCDIPLTDAGTGEGLPEIVFVRASVSDCPRQALYQRTIKSPFPELYVKDATGCRKELRPPGRVFYRTVGTNLDGVRIPSAAGNAEDFVRSGRRNGDQQGIYGLLTLIPALEAPDADTSTRDRG